MQCWMSEAADVVVALSAHPDAHKIMLCYAVQ